MKTTFILGLILSGMIILVGCSAKTVDENVPVTTTESPTQETLNPNAGDSEGIVIGEPNPSTPEGAPAPSGKIDAETAKQIVLENVTGIHMADLDGNEVERTFTDEEKAALVEGLNASEISEDPYIMMLAGNTMVIALNTGDTITFTSYGDETHVVASYSQGYSFHLVCPEIGKVLLEKN